MNDRYVYVFFIISTPSLANLTRTSGNNFRIFILTLTFLTIPNKVRRFGGIWGKVVVCGGISGGGTVDSGEVYDDRYCWRSYLYLRGAFQDDDIEVCGGVVLHYFAV